MLTPQQERIVNVNEAGGTVDSLTCGAEIGVSGRALHMRLFEIRGKGYDVKKIKKKTQFNTTYIQYYMEAKK